MTNYFEYFLQFVFHDTRYDLATRVAPLKPWYLTVATVNFVGLGDLQLADFPAPASCHPGCQNPYKYYEKVFVNCFGMFLST